MTETRGRVWPRRVILLLHVFLISPFVVLLGVALLADLTLGGGGGGLDNGFAFALAFAGGLIAILPLILLVALTHHWWKGRGWIGLALVDIALLGLSIGLLVMDFSPAVPAVAAVYGWAAAGAAVSLWAEGRRSRAPDGTRHRRDRIEALAVAATLVGVVVSTGAVAAVQASARIAALPSVWVANLSPETATFFVTDNSDRDAAWFVVPAHTTAHVGSGGLGSSDVRVNVLGFGHGANHVDKCSPGDYDDTIYDVPDHASVRLLIDDSGNPSVRLAPEPPGLETLPEVPLGNLPEAERCD